MHYTPILTICLAAMSAGLAAAQATPTGHADSRSPAQAEHSPARVGPHGGSLKVVSDLQFETVVDRGSIHIFAFDRQGSSVSVERGRGIAVLRIEGNTKRYRYDLLPNGKDALLTPVNLSPIAGRQIEIDVKLVGVGESGVHFNEVTTVPASEPVSDIELFLGVRAESGKSILFSPVIDMLALAAQAKGADAAVATVQIDRMLADSFQKNSSLNDPDQLEVGIAATVFAFQRNDLDAAEKRIETLNKPLPDEKVREAAVGLWLVAREALKHERTRKYGEKLTERALAAAEQHDDLRWATAIREELLGHAPE